MKEKAHDKLQLYIQNNLVNKTLNMKCFYNFLLFLCLVTISEPFRQNNNDDIHDLLKQKFISKNGDVHDEAKTQNTKSLIPLHVQMMQENQSLQQFLLVGVIGNTMSIITLFLSGFFLREMYKICPKNPWRT